MKHLKGVSFGKWLDHVSGGNDYLVAGAMKMYMIDPANANFAVDGIVTYWIIAHSSS